MKYVLSIGIGLVMIFGYKLYIGKKRFDHTLYELDRSIEIRKQIIGLAEKVGSVQGRTADFANIVQREQNVFRWDDLYEKRQIRLEVLNDKIGRFLSHNIMIVQNYSFIQDEISDDVFFGGREDKPIIAVAEEIYINSEKQMIAWSNKYILPLSNELNITYKKYSLSRDLKKIDTLVVNRKIIFE